MPEETGVFFFQTREEGYGAIFVGAEVHDATLKPGAFITDKSDLSPIGFRKGRRFAYLLVTDEETQRNQAKPPDR